MLVLSKKDCCALLDFEYLFLFSGLPIRRKEFIVAITGQDFSILEIHFFSGIEFRVRVQSTYGVC